MTSGGDTAGRPSAGELKVVGTSVAREIELLFDRVAGAVGRRAPSVLQIGSRSVIADRNERNWRNLVSTRFGPKASFLGVDLESGKNVDQQLDICSPPKAIAAKIGTAKFDLVICSHVLEHTRAPFHAAENIQALVRPGGLVFIATPWSQAFHATPDDFWRFSLRGLLLMFSQLEALSLFYSGGDVGLDVAYRIESGGRPELSPRVGAVEQGLFQLVLDHEDNRAVLARQATERLPVSRTYLPTLFANLVGRRPDA